MGLLFSTAHCTVGCVFFAVTSQHAAEQRGACERVIIYRTIALRVCVCFRELIAEFVYDVIAPVIDAIDTHTRKRTNTRATDIVRASGPAN